MADEDATPGLSPARQRAVDAIVRSATRLFAERGPASVSLREVAADAGVNYGLIHQYVGSKDQLLRLVTRRMSEETARRYAAAPDAATALDGLLRPAGQPTDYIRMLTWAVLEGDDSRELLRSSPALAELTRQLRAEHPDDADQAPYVVAAGAALALGWRVFGSVLTGALDLDDEAGPELDARIAEVAARLLQQ
jgi:AcrR family transcriptional regulator